MGNFNPLKPCRVQQKHLVSEDRTGVRAYRWLRIKSRPAASHPRTRRGAR